MIIQRLNVINQGKSQIDSHYLLHSEEISPSIVIRKRENVAPRSRLTEMEDIERDFIYSESTN